MTKTSEVADKDTGVKKKRTRTRKTDAEASDAKKSEASDAGKSAGSAASESKPKSKSESKSESKPESESASKPKSTSSDQPAGTSAPDRSGGSSESGSEPREPAEGSQRKGRRKRKKKRGGGGNNQQYRPNHDHLPSDEELEREAAELEAIAAKVGPIKDEDQLTISELQRMELDEIFEVAEQEGLEDCHQIPKQDLIFKILKARATRLGIMFGEGTLEIMPDGFGFLRSPEQSYLPGPDDIYVSPSQIRRFGLRRGMTVRGAIRPPKESERYFALLRVESVNGRDPSKIHELVNFEDLTPHHPEE
ncbi:MAG: hypothetical protein D6695_03580, partial [Planctomycetota bacterium]